MIATRAHALTSPRVIPDGRLGRCQGGNRGNVAIYVNGGTHDPEALVTLVQRRVDESMNWHSLSPNTRVISARLYGPGLATIGMILTNANQFQ